MQAPGQLFFSSEVPNTGVIPKIRGKWFRKTPAPLNLNKGPLSPSSSDEVNLTLQEFKRPANPVQKRSQLSQNKVAASAAKVPVQEELLDDDLLDLDSPDEVEDQDPVHRYSKDAKDGILSFCPAWTIFKPTLPKVFLYNPFSIF